MKLLTNEFYHEIGSRANDADENETQTQTGTAFGDEDETEAKAEAGAAAGADLGPWRLWPVAAVKRKDK